MAAGWGKVVIRGACASCTMPSHSILGRMASRGAARRKQSARMHWIAVSMGSGDITGAIKRLLSVQH
jgi:hypothetical protein